MSKTNPYILTVKNLERNYYIDNPDGEPITCSVLKGVTFRVKVGEFIGIMGTSGCGKTTLLKTLGMMTKPDEGTILYKGIDTKKIFGEKLADIRRNELAFIFQDFYLLDSLTVRENIMLPLILNEEDHKCSMKKVEQVAGRFGISKLLDKKPYELSGGEKQRTAICRAMAANPELILADEPTGNLDSNSSLTVIKTLSYINKKDRKTVLLVTHDPKVASYCDKIILLKDGVILKTLIKQGEQGMFYKEIIRNMAYL